MKTKQRHGPMRSGIILGWLFWVSLLSITAQTRHEFSLEACIDYGLEHNKDVQNMRFDTYISERQVKETLSTGLPQLSLQGDLVNNFALPTFIVPFPDPQTGEVTPTESQFGLPWQASVGANLSQLAFDGTYFIGLKAAEEVANISDKNFQRSREETAMAISKAYYQALIGKEMLRLVDANIQRVQKLYEETKVLNEEGFAEKIDVERLEINLTNLQLDRKNAARAALLSMDLLKFQMGMPVLDELVLQEEVDDLELEPASLVSLNEFSFSNRIEYDILQTQRTLETYNMRRIQAGYWPSVYLVGNYAWNRQWDSEQSFEFFVGSLGLQLSMPLFDGLRRRNQVMQSRLNVKKIENNISQLENSIHLELKRSHTQLMDAYNSLERYRRNVELARKVFNVTQIKYKEGIGSSLELNEAESELKASESSYLNALFEYLMARLAYDKARGGFSRYHEGLTEAP